MIHTSKHKVFISFGYKLTLVVHYFGVTLLPLQKAVETSWVRPQCWPLSIIRDLPEHSKDGVLLFPCCTQVVCVGNQKAFLLPVRTELSKLVQAASVSASALPRDIPSWAFQKNSLSSPHFS